MSSAIVDLPCSFQDFASWRKRLEKPLPLRRRKVVEAKRAAREHTVESDKALDVTVECILDELGL